MCRGLWAEEQRVPVDTGRRDAASPTRGNYCQESEHLADGRGMGWVTMVTTSLISLRAGCGPPSQKVFVRINQAVFEVTHNCSCLEQEALVTKRGPGGDA